MVNTGVQVVPGVTKVSAVKNHTLFKVPDGDEWKVPLLHSLLAVRAGDFDITFEDNDADDNEHDVGNDILVHMCTS